MAGNTLIIIIFGILFLIFLRKVIIANKELNIIAEEGKYDFVQLFSSSQSQLEKLVLQCSKAGKYNCIFWACYPKGGGMIKTDIRSDSVWTALEKAGLHPVSQVAIDETWSALRGRPTAMVGKSEEAGAEADTGA